MFRLESLHLLAFPREAVWPVVAKTDWLNRSVGLPKVDYTFEPVAQGGANVTARARVAGLELRWRELPFEWLEPQWYHVHRVFETGPFSEARMGMELHAMPDGTTRALVWSEFHTHNALGRWLAKRLLGLKTRRDMLRVFAHVRDYLHVQAAAPLPRLRVQPVREAAMEAGLRKLRAEEQPAELVGRLEIFLRDSPDVAISHIRPLAVARLWTEDPWRVIELFLHATRAGLLNLSWEVLCPNCRSTRDEQVTSLRRLRRTAHCDVCQIRYDAEFDKSVELKFAVNPAIRPRDEQTFCLSGPGGLPHILAQLCLAPRETRSIPRPGAGETLRLRSLQVREPLLLEAGDARGIAVSCDEETFLCEPLEVSGSLRFYNPHPFAMTVVLEQLGWSDDVLTAARVTNWQEFRDLFANEVVSPDEEVSIGSQVILFTDLRGSTAIYREMGDARAYALIRDHFSAVTDAVSACHGAVVKTIGDAIMAAFSRVDEALRAVQEMHRQLEQVNPAFGPDALKTSLHVGPCLAVNANDRLDYFGTTINLAARMVECCVGGDLAVSDELFQRAECRAFLALHPVYPEPSEIKFRGFEKPHLVWRIPMSTAEQI